MAKHNGGYVFVLVFIWLVFVLLFIIDMFAFFDSSTSLFPNNKFLVPKTSDSRLLASYSSNFVWIITYAYQLAWLLYLTSTYIRTDKDKDFIYIVGPVHHWSFMLLAALTMAQRVIYVFLIENTYLIPGTVLIWTGFGTAVIALILAVVGLFKHRDDLVKVGLPLEHRLVVGFVHNGWAMFVAMMLQEALRSLGDSLYRQNSVNNITGIVLVILFGIYTVYATLDQGFIERYVRFLYTPYVVLIVQEALLMAATWDMSTTITILALGSLITTAIVFLVKIARSIVEEIRKPAFSMDDSDYI